MSLPVSKAQGAVIVKANEIAFKEIDLPKKLDDGQVLIKVNCAPINPSDEYTVAGTYPSGKVFPAMGGLEGAGEVIAAADIATEAKLKGKRVAFFSAGGTSGTWGNYCVANAATCVPLPDDISYEQGACGLVNPLTVEAMMIECEAMKHTCVVHGAASSQLGRMFISAAKQHNVKVVNLCRREENVKMLKGLGAEIVVDIAADKWEETLAATIAEHKPTGFFDPICGEIGSKIITLMPPNSITYCYGGLGGGKYTMNIGDVLFQQKVLRGFWLNPELAKPGVMMKAVTGAIKNMSAGAFKTVVQKRFQYSEIAEALKLSASNATAGKVLLINKDF